jgi:hypothetical protein
MTVSREDDKPWKTDLARKAAQRREQVGQELEDVIKKAPSFEEALRLAVELMKKRFARFSSVTVYVADGEDLAVHTALERPQGPDRVGSSGGPLADAAQGQNPTVFSDLSATPGWAAIGLASGSAMVAPGILEPPGADEAVRRRIPAGRFGTHGETAEAILFLLAGGSYTTGEVLRVDGGRSLA